MTNSKVIKSKINRYKKFWSRIEVDRPLFGIDIAGYFPLNRYIDLSQGNSFLFPNFIKPEEYLENYERFYLDSNNINDDLIRGAAPPSFIPWMECMLGCSAKISAQSQSIWAQERKANWDELEELTIEDDNIWFLKYIDFYKILSKKTNKNYPVGQPTLRGVSDLIGALRGHNQALIDCLDKPDKVKKLAQRCTQALLKVLNKQYDIIEPYYDGYFLEGYSLWAPDKIIRFQEDATSVYSPNIYKDIIQEEDSKIASSFPLSLIHLHSSSLFLIDYFLEIKEIDVFQINKDVCGTALNEMMPYLIKIQQNKRCLLLRGSFTKEDLFLIKNNLSPVGLYLLTVMNNVSKMKDINNYVNNINKIWV